MKKIIIILVLLIFAAGSACATALKDRLVDTKLSNHVSGTYFANDAGTVSASAYALYTANEQGNKVYGSGSFVSEIYEKDTADPALFVSSDLSTITEPAYSSAGFGTGWTAK